jgi:hypothetical protein
MSAKKLNKAFDITGLIWNDRAKALAAFKETGTEITYDDGEEGEARAGYDGERNILLSEALKRFAYDKREHIDGRSLPRAGVGAARPGTASKADFTTIKEKVDFINLHGGETYERLVTHTPMQSSAVVTQRDFDLLPRSEKVRRISEDETCRAKLPRGVAPTPNEGKRTQKEIMDDNLAKHIASTGVR